VELVNLTGDARATVGGYRIGLGSWVEMILQHSGLMLYIRGILEGDNG
jgi:hypothetical protein